MSGAQNPDTAGCVHWTPIDVISAWTQRKKDIEDIMMPPNVSRTSQNDSLEIGPVLVSTDDFVHCSGKAIDQRSRER